MNPYKAQDAEIQGSDHNRVLRRKYNIAISSGLFLIVIAIAVYVFLPSPQAMDVSPPETWEKTKLIGNILLFLGSIIIWITGVVGFLYSDKIWQGIGYIRYLIAILFGLPISLLIGVSYFL